MQQLVQDVSTRTLQLAYSAGGGCCRLKDAGMLQGFASRNSWMGDC